MEQTLRSILPSLQPAKIDQGPPPGQEPGSRRRRATKIACEPCRTKRAACDNARPSCTPCQRRAVTCSYRSSRLLETDDLRRQLGAHEELLHHLRSVPEDEAIQLLRQLRAVEDIPGYLASTERGAAHSLHRPSDLTMARGAGPPSESRVEFELMARHQTAYLKITPVSASFLDRIVKIPVLSPPSQSPRSSDSASAQTSLSDNSSTGAAGPISGVLTLRQTRPSPPPQGDYCDARLQRLRMDYWTRAPVTDDFAAAVLSDFLERDHPILSLFDADVVLDDLVDHGSRVCSPFFVNALMFLACQAFTAIDIRAAPLALCFFEQADMLRRSELAVDTVSNVAASVMFAVACLSAGRDAVGQELYNSARVMGERLGLFGVAPESDQAVSIQSRPTEWISAASYTAWGAFASITAFHYFYGGQPSRYPPTLPIPGDTAPRPHTCPYHSVSCRLWAVVGEIFLVYRIGNNSVPIEERVPPAFFEAKYKKLLECVDQLKTDMVPLETAPLQMIIPLVYFHVIVLILFQPLLRSDSSYRLRYLTAEDSHPRAIYRASVNQLKQLLLQCYLQHGKRMAISTNCLLLMVANALLTSSPLPSSSSSSDEDMKYFFLCIRCCAELYVSYPSYGALAQALLAMALQRGVISGNEASVLFAGVKRRGTHHAAAEEAVLACFIDHRLAETEPDQARANRVGGKFEELSAFDEFTMGDDYEA